MGAIGNAIPFSLINWGETHIDSGLTAILMSSVPLATIMLAPAFVRDEPVTPGQAPGRRARHGRRRRADRAGR